MQTLAVTTEQLATLCVASSLLLFWWMCDSHPFFWQTSIYSPIYLSLPMITSSYLAKVLHIICLKKPFFSSYCSGFYWYEHQRTWAGTYMNSFHSSCIAVELSWKEVSYRWKTLQGLKFLVFMVWNVDSGFSKESYSKLRDALQKWGDREGHFFGYRCFSTDLYLSSWDFWGKKATKYW